MKDYNQGQHKKQGVSIWLRDDVMSGIANIKAELKHGLMDLYIRSGFITLAEMLSEEIKALRGGSWYAHGYDRGTYRWGRTNGQVVLGGRKLGVVWQRLRDLTSMRYCRQCISIFGMRIGY